MTATAHALVGAAIASHGSNPLVSGTLIVSSHFILDAIPHWDFGTDWRKRPKTITGALAIVDTAVGFLTAIVLFSHSLSSVHIVTAVSLALIPDWIEAPWYMFFASKDKKSPAADAGAIERFMFRVYSLLNSVHSRMDLPRGILTQVGTVLFFLFLLT